MGLCRVNGPLEEVNRDTVATGVRSRPRELLALAIVASISAAVVIALGGRTKLTALR
jgi:hypothetical protein